MTVKQKAVEHTKFYIDLANEIYGLKLTYPTVSFKLSGRTAGTANSYKNKIRYNEVLLMENENKFLARTVPHEVAHIVANKKAGHRVKPHGIEWKLVMRDLGVEDITRCHSYDTSNSTKRSARRSVQSGYLYECACREHNLTVIRHRRIQKGMTYTCRSCKTKLKEI